MRLQHFNVEVLSLASDYQEHGWSREQMNIARSTKVPDYKVALHTVFPVRVVEAT